MSSNFTFISTNYSHLYEAALPAENHAVAAPRTSAFHARHAMEVTIKWLFRVDRRLVPPYRSDLNEYMRERSFRDILPHGLMEKLDIIRKLGNFAVHQNKKIKKEETVTAVRYLYEFYTFIGRYYPDTPLIAPAFDESLIPTKGTGEQSSKELQTLQQTLEEKDSALQEMKQELETLRNSVATNIEKNIKKIPAQDYTEAQTRDIYIDLLLREADWDITAPNVIEYKVTGMPSNSGIGKVDYVLWGNDGLPLAVVEAKKTKIDPATGARQAELYADCLEKMTGQRPFIFYTNGYESWFWDDRRYPPRKVLGFFSRDELQTLMNRRGSYTDPMTLTLKKSIANRPYQIEAMGRMVQAFHNKSREALFVMATGTGKTRTTIAAVDLLMRANWVKRVLFLADRTALVKQAMRAFNAHLSEVPTSSLLEEKENLSARIIFSTYPTMMNAIDDMKGDRRLFGVGHFDLIVVDEAHRSIYLKYKAIFEYFDALLLGLTATPKDEIDRNTYRLFHMPDGVPTFAYELDEAVRDGYLVPPKAVSVPLKFQREGIKYEELSEEEKDQYELEFADEDGNVPEMIYPDALNQWLFNEDTVDKVLGYLMQNALKVEGGDRIGKTIIFAKNHKHAEFIKQRFDIHYPQYMGQGMRVIDNTVKYAQSLIDDFTQKEKAPFIAVSVDMLDTGIDVPELVNLVIFKLVRSKAKFWQMIGRGTRLCPNLFAPKEDKKHFYVFDFCDNFAFFDAKPDGVESTVQRSLSERLFSRRVDLIYRMQETKQQKEALYAPLVEGIADEINRLDTNSFLVRSKRQFVDTYSDSEKIETLNNNDIVNLHKEIAPLILPEKVPESTRRFDLLLSNLQLAHLQRDESGIQRYQKQLIEIAKALEKKRSVPSVKAELTLIERIQTESFWKHLSLKTLEKCRIKLRDLVELIEKTGESVNPVYTDFEDELGEGSDVSMPTGFDLTNYQKKVEHFLKSHLDHPAIQKIHTGEKLGEVDLSELEAILCEQNELTYEQLHEMLGEETLGRFVRKIIGMDQQAIQTMLSDVYNSPTITPNQMRLLDKVVRHVMLNGVVDDLSIFMKDPFTEEDPMGIMALGEHIGTLKAMLERVNQSVAA